MLTIRWTDPTCDDKDEPEWAVWDTRCGVYRILYIATTDTYRPTIIRVTKIGRDTTERLWVPVACDQPTLDQAFAAINDYHCSKHNLILVH